VSVILLSDSSGQRTSDEHMAFDLSAGRTLLPLSQPAKHETDPQIDPEPEPVRPMLPPPAAPSAEDDRDDQPRRELPASTYLPASG
jgi:hypothetical protein